MTALWRALQDLARLLDRHYLAAKAGDLLHRSLRRRVSQVMLAFSAGLLGARAQDGESAGLAAVVACACGLLALSLQIWATQALGKRLSYAHAHGGFLLKDRKKSELLDDLPRLWRRVYALDVALAFPDRKARKKMRKYVRHLERKARGNAPETRRFDLGYLLAHERASLALLSPGAFRAAAEYELKTTHPQQAQDARLGFSLALLEDALDATALEKAARAASNASWPTTPWPQPGPLCMKLFRYTGAACTSCRTPSGRYLQAFWRRNVALALEARAGRLLQDLHRRYRTGRIDAQDLLWQDSEALFHLSLAVASDGQPPIAQAIRDGMTDEARRVYSKDSRTVKRLVRRMHGFDLVQASLLLAARDPAYAEALGSGQNPDSPRQGPPDPYLDLALAGAGRADARRLRQACARGKRETDRERLQALRLRRELAAWETGLRPGARLGAIAP